MKHYGYIKTACATFPLSIGNVQENTNQLLSTLKQISDDTRIVVFPELCLCGTTCNDLFYQQTLLQAAIEGLKRIVEENESKALLFIGLPMMHLGQLYNCVAIIHQHDILAIIPKSNITSDQRWFTSGKIVKSSHISLLGQLIPFQTNILIHDAYSKAIIGCEIGDDLYCAIAPSTYHVQAGANIIVHPCSSAELVHVHLQRREHMTSTSLLHHCAYVSNSSDMSESTTDLLYSGEKRIVELGKVIAEANFMNQQSILYGEIDVDRIIMQQCRHPHGQLSQDYQHLSIALTPYEITALNRMISPYPFVPSDITKRLERCKHILAIQAAGLAMRMKKIYCQKLVIGISGGLDSTLALIVCIKAMELLNLDPANIITITMPGFGTSKRTKGNSHKLMEALGTTIKEISIHDACLQHFKDIEHDPSALDITFENTQARERTQILMDYANKLNALVVGTGDLSELALGWCTYNGDHMSMYAVNGSIPKTLIRHLVHTFGQEMREKGNTLVADTLEDICATPVSPELLPPKEDGNIAQETEKSIGSYDYHDFFLYYMLKYGMTPSKIFFLAKQAFTNTAPQVLKDTMKMFYRRFFTQQFKRSCMPDGVKVGSISLSPRGDLRMPSDASYHIWMQEVEALEV